MGYANLNPRNLSCYPRKNIYDNVEEFWILLREKGSRKQAVITEERHHQQAAAPRPNINPKLNKP